MTSPPPQHQDWHHRAEMALETAVRSQRTITYAMLAEAATIPAPHRIHQLTVWLEETMRIDHAAGRPLRAAIVISRNRAGLPAPGFFETCHALGLYSGSHHGVEAVRFHQMMLAQLAMTPGM